jgi:8-amino-7-oxononanoate synthase
LGFAHVVPWVIGAPADAVNLSDALRAEGIDVRAIRPPSVPAGTARLRFAITADHRDEDIDRVLRAAARVTGRPL